MYVSIQSSITVDVVCMVCEKRQTIRKFSDIPEGQILPKTTVRDLPEGWAVINNYCMCPNHNIDFKIDGTKADYYLNPKNVII